jgi:hypothetical protein
MVVRMRKAGFVERIVGPRPAVLCKNLDITGAQERLTETLPEAGSLVRAVSLRHPDREASKDCWAYEPKWMRDGLTIFS